MRRKNKENEDSPANELQHNSDPVIQKKDEPKNRKNKIQPEEDFKNQNAVPSSEVKIIPRQSGVTRYSEQTTRSGNDLLKSMLHFKWTIVLIFLITAIPATVLIWTQIIPKYQAKAQIHVKPIVPYLVFQTEDSGMRPMYSSFMNTQVSIIRSTTVLQRVLDDISPQTKWIKMQDRSLLSKLKGNKKLPIERLRDDLSVRPLPNTEIIDVSFIDANADDAETIVNAVLDEYLDYVKNMTFAAKNMLEDTLNTRYGELQTEIVDKEDAIKRLFNSIDPNIPEELVKSKPEELVLNKRAKIGLMKERLSEVRQNIADLEWNEKQLKLVRNNDGNDIAIETAEQLPLYEEDGNDVTDEKVEQVNLYEEDGNDVSDEKAEQVRLYEEDANDVPVNAAEEPPYYEDSEWRNLDINVKTIQHQIDTSLLTDTNPDMAKMKEDLEFAKNLLKNRELQLDKMRRSGSKNMFSIDGTTQPDYGEQLKNIQYQKELAKQKEHNLIQNLKVLESTEESALLFKKIKELEKLKSELSSKRELLETVRQRKVQKDTEKLVPPEMNIEILMDAFVPREYFNDRRGVYTAMALFMAFGLGCGVAFLRAYRNQLVFAAEDIPLPARVPQLGFLPLINLKKSIGRPLCDEIEKSQFLLVESVRVMRTTLLSKLEDQKSAVVLISSSTAGTGKSSFTRILGKSIAKSGKDVLIIDADFHKRTLTKLFNLVDQPGFLDCLSSKTQEEIEVFSTEIPKMKFLPAGNRNKDFVFEEIANGTFRACIEHLRKQFSIILLDCSPVVPIADAAIISSQVDGTIMVERELVSRRENVINAVARLGSANGHLLGVVFVGSPDEKIYGYGYEDYYRTERN